MAQALAPTNHGTIPRCGPPNNKQRFAVLCGPALPRPRLAPLSSAQRTTARPSPARAVRRQRAATRFGLKAEARLLFFEPTGNGVARNPERAREAAQAGALLIGTQDQFALFGGVAVRAWISRRASSAIPAAKSLTAVGRSSIAHHIQALAMRTRNGKSNHSCKDKS